LRLLGAHTGVWEGGPAQGSASCKEILCSPFLGVGGMQLAAGEVLSLWQKQSEQLRAAMRATKPQAAGSGGGASGWGGGAQVEEVGDSK
jgi:hypothetical protein